MNRRNVVRAVGSLTTMGMVGVGTAQNDDEERIKREVERAFQNEGVKGVKKVLKKYNIDYIESKSPIDRKKAEGSEVTPQWGYGESGSTVSLMLAEGTKPERIWATVLMELEGVDPMATYYKGVDDAIGISFDGAHWSVVGSTHLTINHPSDVEEDGDISWYSQSLKDGGLAAEVELPVDRYLRGAGIPPEWTDVSLMTELRNLDGVPGNIFGSYHHNGGGGPIQSISGGAGPISVDLSWNGSKVFDATTVRDPDKYI